jgi:hypothetical protein
MAKFSLVGSTVSIDGTSSCVESGDVDLGELNLVETTCSSNKTKTYTAGTFNNASGSVTINDTDALAQWLADYGTDAAIPSSVPIVFNWPDTGTAALTFNAYITDVSFPVGVDQAATITFNFTGSQAITSFTP